MPTTITKSVGTSSRDYSTLQAALNALPASLVTADEAWVFELYNDSEFNESILITGKTTDATRNVTIRCATGQSFKDHGSKLSNALRYDQSKGVGFSFADPGGSLAALWNFGIANLTIDGIQFKNTNTLPGVDVVRLHSGFSTTILKNCIVCSPAHDVQSPNSLVQDYGGNTIINCLLYAQRSKYGILAMGYWNTGAVDTKIVACTILQTSSNASSTGIATGGMRATVYDTGVFGFTTNTDTSTGTGGNNAGDDTNSSNYIGSSNVTSLTTSSQFEGITGGSEDCRVKVGSGLINAGQRQQSYTADLDIVGSARSTSTPTIGAWEYAATASGSRKLMLLGVG